MDPEVSLLLHCAPWKGLREEQVQVELSEKYNRNRATEVEQHIEEVWTERVTREPWLFNGAKFRLFSASLTPPPSCNAVCGAGDIYHGAQKEKERDEHTQLTLQLGLTCYKDFLGTNWSAGVGALMRRGVAEFGDAHAFLAQPLGVGGVLQTMDGLVVMLRRSQKVAEAPGLLDIPGGHPEPKAVCLGVSEDSIQLEQLSESAVIRELFSSVCTEIRDEVNIPLSSLSEPVLMGIALNHTSAGRPSAEFYISCSLSSKEVKEFYWQGGPEAHESTDIVFLSQKEVMQLDVSAPLWKELCPSAKGAVMLYRIVLWDNN
ncbi:hypothetical protein AGOR_G00074840 [Albula goreensis]|uniref:Nudix hydrolase domain-containing protein n=1 Tax=Albula goreensis TaxID=1534307 RepID=A0A8T3DTG2_9TELE|nr:hypothetical protein AGOR_G00074840 [Albula goreensis]